jgi:hypothetical protein
MSQARKQVDKKVRILEKLAQESKQGLIFYTKKQN